MSSLSIEFLKSGLQNNHLEITAKTDGREGVDFLIGNHQIYVQSLDLDTVKQSIKIPKQNLGVLNDNLFIALVLIIGKPPSNYMLRLS